MFTEGFSDSVFNQMDVLFGGLVNHIHCVFWWPWMSYFHSNIWKRSLLA